MDILQVIQLHVTDAIDPIKAGEIMLGLPAAVEKLPPRQKKVVRLRFGLDNCKACTLLKIAEMMHISPSKARQNLNQGIAKKVEICQTTS